MSKRAKDLIEEECGRQGLREFSMDRSVDDLVEFLTCAKGAVTEAKHRDEYRVPDEGVVLGNIEDTGPNMPHPNSRRGTTGQRVTREVERVKIHDGSIVIEEGTDVQSDPAMGPRFESHHTEKVTEYGAAARILEKFDNEVMEERARLEKKEQQRRSRR